jgi:hypothetical protein
LILRSPRSEGSFGDGSLTSISGLCFSRPSA